MLELILVRHGESFADVENCYAGQSDFPLTEHGGFQATQIAETLEKQCHIDLIYSSPLLRSFETAQIIQNISHCPLSQDDRISDWDCGVIAGMNKKEAELKYPKSDVPRLPHEAILGGESLLDFRQRVECFMSMICGEYDPNKNKTICIVTHGLVINMMFRSFLKLPFIDDIHFKSKAGEMYRWKINSKGRSIVG